MEDFANAKLSVPDFKAKMGGIVVTVYRKMRGNEGLNEKLNKGLNSILVVIERNPGIQAKDISDKLNRPIKTVERQISELKKMNLIERRGSKKTGGYYAK